MFLITIWIASIIATLYIADQKRRGIVGYFFLSLVTGPLAVLIVLLVSDRKVAPSSHAYEANSLEDAKRQLRDLRSSLYAQEEKIKNLEVMINKLSGSPKIMTAQPVTVTPVETPRTIYTCEEV